MSAARIQWTDEMLRLEALKYKERDLFQKGSNSAYQSARRRGKEFFSGICSHMPKRKNISGDKNPNFKWTNRMLAQEARKYKFLLDFQIGSNSAYIIAHRRGILDQICSHMPKRDFFGESNPNYRWKNEDLRLAALPFDTIVDFQYGNGAAYQAAWDRGILAEICSHMKPAHGSSREELEILGGINEFFPEAKKKRTKRIKIFRKPHIKMFELDILIPSLNLAIEYDGDYWHSYEAMKKSTNKKHWPDSDIRNYHGIKDKYFASIGITILHIKEFDWIENRASCISKIERFLGITGFMKEQNLKAA